MGRPGEGGYKPIDRTVLSVALVAQSSAVVAWWKRTGKAGVCLGKLVGTLRRA